MRSPSFPLERGVFRRNIFGHHLFAQACIHGNGDHPFICLGRCLPPREKEACLGTRSLLLDSFFPRRGTTAAPTKQVWPSSIRPVPSSPSPRTGGVSSLACIPVANAHGHTRANGTTTTTFRRDKEGDMGCYPPLDRIVSKALGKCNGKLYASLVSVYLRVL